MDGARTRVLVLVWFDRQGRQAVGWMIWTGNKQGRRPGVDSSREIEGYVQDRCDRVRYDQRQQPQRATLQRSL